MRVQRIAKAIAASLSLFLIAVGQAAATEDEYAAVRGKLELCTTCHGPNGASSQPKYPILAGQHLYYLYVQMKDFKAGRRASPEMQPIVEGLSKEDMLSIAKFFSEQPWPRISYNADPTLARDGSLATVAGQCVQCHRGGYEGNSGTPRLGGQHATYLEKTMMDFKSKARANSPAKSSLMESYTTEQISGMAEFMAGM